MMQTMIMGAIFFRIIVSFCLYRIAKATPMTLLSFKNTGNDDLLFNEDLVFEVAARSKVECANRCADNQFCVAFTFVKSLVSRGSSGLCRGSSGLTVSGSTTAKSGARTYIRPADVTGNNGPTTTWLGETCLANSDCPNAFATTCHKERCLCKPEHYYSNGTDSCVDTCQQSDLGTTFLEYAGIDVVGSNSLYIDDYDQPDLHACQSDCVNHPECHSISFGIGNSYASCWRIREFAGSDVSSPEAWAVYKRNCA